MDFMNMLILIVGVGTAAIFVIVLSYAGALGLIRAWRKIAHRHDGHHAH
jgi:hypothetical protein